jgi:hypothetical protein
MSTERQWYLTGTTCVIHAAGCPRVARAKHPQRVIGWAGWDFHRLIASLRKAGDAYQYRCCPACWPEVWRRQFLAAAWGSLRPLAITRRITHLQLAGREVPERYYRVRYGLEGA